MRKRKLGSGVGFGHRTLKVEQLEQRAMLAGNVAVSVSGGNLIITGDNHDNAVLIQEVVDEDDNPNTHAYLITGFDFADSGLPGFESGPTIINGAGEEVEPDLGGTSARVVTGITANIVIDLKKGNDVLGVGNSVEDLLLLADECGFGLGIGSGSGGGSSSPSIVAEDLLLTEKFTAPISLVINMGDGTNAVAVNGDIGVNNNAGSLVINGGKNTDFVAVGGSSEFESESTIHGDLAIVTQNGNDNICVHNATIFGAMAINAGNGFNVVSGENFRAAAATIVSGKNDDNIFLGGFALDTALTINAGNGNNNVFIEEFNAGQGNGPNELPHGGGAVTIVTGSGNDNVGAQFFEADNVVISTGSGNDGSAEERTIALQLQPIFEGPITVHFATITHSLVVSTGNGNDLVDVDAVEAHDIVVDTGAGNDGNDEGFPVEVDNVTVAGNVTLLGGPGNDNLEVLNEFEEVEGAHIGGNLLVDAGAGNDIVQLGGFGDEGLDVGLNVTVLLGAGNDSADIFEVRVGLNMIVNAGAGSDFVDIEDCAIIAILNVAMGAGDDRLEVFDTDFGTLIADGGSGKDEFDNDLDVTSNGNFDFDSSGVPHIIVRNFEFFGD